MRTDLAIRHWSTDAAAPAERLDYWVGAVCEGFLEMEVTSPQPRSFAAELTSAPLGALQLNRVRGSAQDVYRTRRAVARSEQDYFYLLCKTDSDWITAQRGRAVRLTAGDLVLVDSRHCYEFHFQASCDTLSLQLPTAWIDQWLPAPETQVARRIDGRSGFGAALSAFARELQPELASAPPLPAALLTDQLGALLALATGADSGCAPDGPAQSDRIIAAIRERHAEPGLTATEVAAGLHISGRSLHRALAGSGRTFAALLTESRLDAARRMLGDARFGRLTVGEIGRRVGLLDPSHFVRAFRRHAGHTPGALRRRR